ncbi:MAG: DNA/RNA non-specific endonuclease [Pyrinomonadaceae bacterium]|nr:DNA/RNA non-specific endonuclease [Pyrinomonadaceae bacterium]
MKRLAILALSFIFVLCAANGVSASGNVVISQIYGGGGSATASPYNKDFIEIFNRSNAPVSLNGWSVQYASATGSTWQVTSLSNVTLNDGQYYLISEAGSTSVPNTPNLPTPDVVGGISMSQTSAKVALVDNSVALTGTCPTGVVDFVGYGTNANCFEGSGTTASVNVVDATFRASAGCQDTDQNAADFANTTALARNTASTTNPCNGGGGTTSLSGRGAANPTSVAPNSTVLLTVTVTPADAPQSTGISVVGNLSTIGSSSTQIFFNDATNGDVTANDNVYSYTATIPGNSSGGNRNLSATITDAQGRTASSSISLTINSVIIRDNPLALGNPSNAVTDVNQPSNYLMLKPQYSLSYNRDKGIPNWVAWHLDTSWLGSAPRQDDYRPDTALPSDWYRVMDNDYTGSGYTRGHMCPSGDRTSTIPDNSATFLMTNFVPQSAANNNGPWNNFELFCRGLVQSGNEVYIVTGGVGSAGTIAGGRINIPVSTWKVVLVLPNGDNDLQRINKLTRTIAIVVPNQGAVNSDWRQYRTSVRQVERLTGYNFFSNVPRRVQALFKSRIDNQ